MLRRVAAVALLGALLLGCGGPPPYTREQAEVDMSDFVHIFNSQSKKYNDCIVNFLFHKWSPEQVRAEIRAGDFTTPSPMLLAAKTGCARVLPETGGCRDASPTATTSPSAPKVEVIETSGATVYLNLRSARQQMVKGDQSQTVVMPNPASINLGDNFVITNHSAGVLTVKSTDYTKIFKNIGTAAPGSVLVVTCETPTIPGWSASGQN